MKLKEFVNARVETVEPGDTLQRAAEKMGDLDIGSLPVCDNGQLVGVITDRDITIRAVAKGSDPVATGNRLLAGETLESVSEESGARREDSVDNDLDDGEIAHETRVTGILHDSEAAKKAIAELKSAGFMDETILIAMDGESAQEKALGRAISDEELPSLPNLNSGEILIMVKAGERIDAALDILKRHHAVTAGVRIPAHDLSL
jgi:CBS domain-containing protein